MSKPTILLVDDEGSIINALQRTLRHIDCRLLTAENASQAVEILEQHSIQLIITDYKMPGMRGRELLKLVAERWPGVFRILLTGMSSPDTTEEIQTGGAIQELMYKPWDDEQLRKLVTDHLGGEP
jgi:DNA-binding NtrC family response regulator